LIRYSVPRTFDAVTGGCQAFVPAVVEGLAPLVDEAEVVTAIEDLWTRPQREHRYAGCLLASRWAPKASPALVDHVARWITTDPWWDTCDPLARACAGQVVHRHPELRPTMDRWLAGDDVWFIRAALIHMGGWKRDIDRDWVFAACQARADHPDFFVRKAIGWILRDLAWVDPEAVAAFVASVPELSGLSKREALKNCKTEGDTLTAEPAIVVGHSATNEAAVLGLTDQVIAFLAEGTGVRFVLGQEGVSVTPLP